MPKITIGLPVFNGETHLAECLDSLLEQTFTDFFIEIYDNASTDKTSEIAREYASQDSRIRYHRHDENIGMIQNFNGALKAAETEYFLWRADDDLASPDFLERLYHKLEATPAAALAVSQVRRLKTATNDVRITDFYDDLPVPTIINIFRRMKLCHQSWVYGMWRTDKLKDYFDFTLEKYPSPWAQDFFVLLLAILDSAVVGDNRAHFIQRIGSRHTQAPSEAPSLTEVIEKKEEAIDEYLPACRSAAARTPHSFLEKFILHFAVESYARKRVKAKRSKILRLKIQHFFSKNTKLP